MSCHGSGPASPSRPAAGRVTPVGSTGRPALPCRQCQCCHCRRPGPARPFPPPPCAVPERAQMVPELRLCGATARSCPRTTCPVRHRGSLGPGGEPGWGRRGTGIACSRDSESALEESEKKLCSDQVLSPKDPEWLRLKSAMCLGVSLGRLDVGMILLSCWGLRRGGPGCDTVQHKLSLLD